MPAAPDRELNAVLEELVAGVRPILGSNYVGAYLQGSFAVGDWDTGSDVDFLFVVNEDVPEALAPALQDVHVRVFATGSYWAQHLEGSYFPADWLRRLDTRGWPLLYINNGSQVLERSSHDNTMVVRWVMRERGVTLVGPEARTLLGPVPPDALRREAYGKMAGWVDEILADPQAMNNGWYQPYAVLNFSRMLRTLVEAEVYSKPAAGAWAKETLDPRWKGLIERALAKHAGQFTRVFEKADPADFELTLEFVRYVLAQANRVYPSGQGER